MPLLSAALIPVAPERVPEPVGRGYAACHVPGCRRYREYVGRCGAVAVDDIQPGKLGNAVAELGDGKRIGSDHRPRRADGRCIRRPNERDSQRLASGNAMTITDICDEFDLEYIARMQEVEICTARLIGPLQDNRSAVARHAVERHIAGSDQAPIRRCCPAPSSIRCTRPWHCRSRTAVNVSPTSASWTLSVPVTGPESPVSAGGMYPAEILSISNAFELLASTTLLKGCRPENSTYPFEENELWLPVGNSGEISLPV